MSATRTEKKRLKLSVFLSGNSRHLAAWRHTDALAYGELNLTHYIQIAKTAERGKFDAIFLADTVDLSENSDQALNLSGPVDRFEAVTLLTALSHATERIGLIATASIAHADPYNLASKFASLDHISCGRAGCNLVAGNAKPEYSGPGRQIGYSAHFENAGEYIRVLSSIWDSWQYEAYVYDQQNYLTHAGLNMAAPYYGYPVIAQSGKSDAAMELAAQTADMVFSAQGAFEDAKAFYSKLKGKLVKYGRSPEQTKIMSAVFPVIGRTEREARDKYEMLQSQAGRQHYPGVAGAEFQQAIIGTPVLIADQLEDWFVNGAVDGFNIMPPCLPGSLDDFVNLVIPELQRRDLFRTEYEGTTLRENLGLAHPENPFNKRAFHFSAAS
ncbi:LLM class flavin-dependent oxidoreductase [Methylobacter sp.]|uniref:LLM class flavin-dependent oxidoreductase n=1 Tax=Methylobacter sp. TaxID=2051955 RepID=UPI003DA62034